MSAGDGYKYLLKTIAAADGDRSLSTPLTRYYAEAGTPPGRWLGAGVLALGKGELSVGDRVSEAQLHLLIGMGETHHWQPTRLGVPELQDPAGTDRIPNRRARSVVDPGSKGEAVAQIVAEETAREPDEPWRASTSLSRFRSPRAHCGPSLTPGCRH
nr:relaxase domain-containing protein [Tessaracoccus coleopterorum]